ncbi:NUDIX hydrolase [Methylobacterium nigriterrae]|uniref:NUDIX hydrolase n=1 Tax=Methylobacterium nigriterrae TaxID=3127512 RepID=UPI0030136F16
MSDRFRFRPIHRGWNTFGIATLTLPDGSQVERALEDHGEALAVLPYDPDRRVAVLVRQVRVGPMFWGDRPDIAEVPAGGLDGEDARTAALREVLEEAGLSLTELELVSRAYAMPGVSSERLWLYLAPFAAADRIGDGGGLAHEGEQIAVEEVALADLATAAMAGRIDDLKTLALVQALQLRRPDRFEP